MLIKNRSFSAEKINLILLLIVIGLILIVVNEPGLDNTSQLKKITQVDPATIHKIIIRSEDNKIITFIQQKSQWYVKHGSSQSQVRADKIKFLFDLLNTKSLESFSVTTDQLQQYRLLKPRIVVNFNNVSIAFGISEPLKHRRYILIGNQIHLINDFFYPLLLQDVKKYQSASQ